MTKTRNMIMFGGGTVLILLIAVVVQQIQISRFQRSSARPDALFQSSSCDLKSVIIQGLEKENSSCQRREADLQDQLDSCLWQRQDKNDDYNRDPYEFIPWTGNVPTDEQQSAPATTTVRYVNREKGISIDLPYSYYWGTYSARIGPFDELNAARVKTDIKSEVASVMFGPYQTVEGGEDRVLALSFEYASSSKDVTAYGLRLATKRIGSLEVVEYDDGGDLCSGASLVVIGKKYNYRLSTFCGAFSLEQLETMVKSIKLVE